MFKYSFDDVFGSHFFRIDPNTVRTTLFAQHMAIDPHKCDSCRRYNDSGQLRTFVARYVEEDVIATCQVC